MKKILILLLLIAFSSSYAQEDEVKKVVFDL
ncbi:hypothetical protein HG1285_12347, partial [Hydrogenivirga sp. 128-5-R1-1]